MNEFEIRTRDGISYLACPPFEVSGFIAAFSTRDGAREGEDVTATAKRLVEALGVHDVTVATAKQVHSATVIEVSDPTASSTAVTECDGMVARRAGLLLGIKTADCVPVLIADRLTGAVGAAHAGWRGAMSRIAERTFARMMGTYASRGADCIAAVGPAICADCFEVGAEVVDRFREEFPYSDRLISNEHDGKGHIDLKLACQIQLELCGLPPEQIYVTDDCTRCMPERYFSYRLEGAKAGRILSVVGQLAIPG